MGIRWMAAAALVAAGVAAARSWKGVVKGLGKGARTTCQEQGDEEPLCFEGAGVQIGNLQSNVDASQENGHTACDAEAPAFPGYCQFGIP